MKYLSVTDHISSPAPNLILRPTALGNKYYKHVFQEAGTLPKGAK